MPQPSFYNSFARDDAVRKDLATVRSTIVQISSLESRIFSEFSSSDLEQLREMLDQVRILSSRLHEHSNFALNRVEDEIEKDYAVSRALRQQGEDQNHAEA